jgi:hypothetical protein
MIPTTLSLVVPAAFIHASWNILLKRVQGGLSFLWFVDILQSLVFAPWIAWVIYRENPALGVVVLHRGKRHYAHRLLFLSSTWLPVR